MLSYAFCMPLRHLTFCLAVFLLAVAGASAQPRAPQVDASALTAAAARLGRVIWTPDVRLDRAGIDPFVLRASEAPGCERPGPGCLPHYRPDFVVGGVAGADVWMNLNEQLLVQLRGRAVSDWYREFTDQSGVAPDISQALRYVAPRFHLDFGWRHSQSRRGSLTEVAQRITRTAFDRRLTAAARLGRFALETEWGLQRVRYARPAVAHPSFRYDRFDGDLTRWRHVLRPAVPGPSRWSFTFERVAQQALHRPVRERRVRGTTVMLETELLTGLRLEGRVAVGWTHLVRPDYHRQLGQYSARTSAPVWRAELLLPSEATRLDFRLERRFSQSVLPGPPSVSELRADVRAGRSPISRSPASLSSRRGRITAPARRGLPWGSSRCGTSARRSWISPSAPSSAGTSLAPLSRVLLLRFWRRGPLVSLRVFAARAGRSVARVSTCFFAPCGRCPVSPGLPGLGAGVLVGRRCFRLYESVGDGGTALRTVLRQARQGALHRRRRHWRVALCLR